MTKSSFRLDYISDFDEEIIQKMSDMRSKYIELENYVSEAFPLLVDEDLGSCMRVFEEALTHLEQSQMYAIKMLCLLGEK